MRPKSLLVTSAGFGILLVLIATSGAIAVMEARRIFDEQTEINRMDRSFRIALEGLRSEVFLASIYVRDLILDSQSAAADEQRQRLNEGEEAVRRHLQELKRLVPPELSPDIDELRTLTEGFWTSVAPALEDPDIGALREFASMRKQFLARRDSALSIIRRIEEINEDMRQARRDKLAESQSNFISYIGRTMTLAVILGVVVAVASGHRILTLQRRAERERIQTENAEAEMRNLSYQLLQAQEDERKRLSRELHDEVGQTLTALGLELGVLEQLRNGPDSGFAEHLHEAKRLTQDTLGTVRNIAMGLRPSMLDDSGLAPALRWQIREFSKRSGIEVSVQIDGDVDSIGDPQRTCIYRVVQEALTNCARHSRARSAQVGLTGRAGVVEVKVQDDGIGFVKTENAPGMGLIGIEERIRELGGKVRVVSRLGEGTQLWAQIPLSES